MKTFKHNQYGGIPMPGYCKWLRFFQEIEKGQNFCLHKNAEEMWGTTKSIGQPGVRLTGIYCHIMGGRRKHCCEEGEL